MVIIDRALAERERQGRPIQVALVGAGFAARGIALQLLNVVPGMRLAAVANRHPDGARRLYVESGVSNVRLARRPDDVTAALAQGAYAVTTDARVVCQAEGIDVVVEATGTVEFGAHVVVEAIACHRHVVLVNVGLDATLGPLLKARADRAGVILTNMDGDQPAAMLNLYRFVKGIGVTPVLCGNIKTFLERDRTPDGSVEFARTWAQRPTSVTSYTDGTHLAFEQAMVANATGMRVGRRGMYGPRVPVGTPIEEAVQQFSCDELLAGPPLVDYVLGAVPAFGVFVLGTHEHPVQRRYLQYYKMGPGPLYCFYTPHHLCHFEVHNAVARAVLFGDAAIAPLAGPVVEVVTTAKTALAAGQVLDGVGGYYSHGQCENADVARREGLLPMGLSEGCRLLRDVAKGEAVTFADVEVPAGRLAMRLWDEQRTAFDVSA
jgi:predicted homoserine dehydrogenase-like protein